MPSHVLFVDARGLVQPLDVALIEHSGERCLAIHRSRRPARLEAGGAADRNRESNERSTIVREVYSGDPAARLFVVHSDEWQAHDREIRERSMAACRAALKKLAARVARGPRPSSPGRVAKAADRILERHGAHRYFTWEVDGGAFRFYERPQLAREVLWEGKYVIRIEKPASLRGDQRGRRGGAQTVAAALALLLERALERAQSASLPVLAVEALQALEGTRIIERSVAAAQGPRGRPTDRVRRLSALRGASLGATS